MTNSIDWFIVFACYLIVCVYIEIVKTFFKKLQIIIKSLLRHEPCIIKSRRTLLSASTLSVLLLFIMHGSCLSVYDFVASWSVTYHCNWNLKFFLDKFDILAAIFRKLVILCNSSDIFLPTR